MEERERKIKALRGNIYDRNGTALALNQSVCTVSVIHNPVSYTHLVVSYENLMACQSYTVAKEKGLVGMEGKEYVVKDGDVILFRFNV